MSGMLEKIVDSFLSKIWEKLFDYVEHTVRDITDYESTFQSLKRKLKKLSVQSSDVEEELNSAELSGKKKRKREVENWLEEVKELANEIGKLETEVQSEGFVSRFLGGGRAAELKERAIELVEQRKHFGELVLDARETGEELLTTMLVGKAFEENLGKVENFLGDDSVKSIGIYGMGGVGKTTLTRHINNKLVKENQNCVFWVTVSHESSIRVLQDKISHVLGLELSDENDEEKRAARLNRALSSLRKNVVLILDDVWENINLEKVGDPLSVDGCRLIITTRSLQLCHQIGCQQEILVETLDMDESWNLFSEKLGEEITTHSPDVKIIAKSMAELCDGLPLGIITLAGSMRGETDIRVWRNALEELHKSIMEHDEMEDKVFKVLKYSFDRLDPKHQRRRESNKEFTNLQLCFLYCCLYPEDWNIRKSELVRKFILEELVDKRKTWGAQLDEGHTILNKLLNVCLLESSKDYWAYNCVKMHDLVRAMALKITQEKYKVLIQCQLKHISNEEEYWMKDKITLMGNDIKEIPDGFSPNCPNLSTLLLQYTSLEFIANSFFSQMHGLCVLDLSNNCEITKLPNSLSELECLKALLLENCEKLVYVPYLGRLKALKALDLSKTSIEEVPQGMENLLNLNFLSLDTMLPKGLLLKFLNLHCLHLPFDIIAPIDEIERLEQLEEFNGRVNDIYDFNRLIRSIKKSQSQSWVIKIAIKAGTDFFELNYSDFVENNNNEVVFGGCNLSQEDMPIILADNVQCLKIMECEGLSKCLLDDFSKFNNPKSLKILRIFYCKGIECIMEKQEIGVGVGVALPTPAQAVFSSLTKLEIMYCPKMKKLGLTGSELPNIEEIIIRGCIEIEEIIEQAEGDADVVLFPKLRTLDVLGLPRLKSICRGRMKCDSIVYIRISGCRELKRIPLYFRKEREAMGTSFITSYSYSLPPALKQITLGSIHVKEWWDSLEWEHPDHKSLLQPFVEFLN